MQAEFDDTPKLISQATGMVNFCQVRTSHSTLTFRGRCSRIISILQFLGGTIGLAIAEVTFSSELVRNLREYAPGAPFRAIQQSPLSIYSAVPEALVPGVVRAYV